MKLGTSLLYFHDSHLLQATINEEMGLCKENHVLFLKICMSSKIMEPTIL